MNDDASKAVGLIVETAIKAFAAPMALAIREELEKLWAAMPPDATLPVDAEEMPVYMGETQGVDATLES